MYRPLILFWLAAALLLVANRALADGPAPGKAIVSNRPGEEFASIQAALNAALADSVIQIGEGRFDERLSITKPVKLIGAGTDKTVIGPTAAARDAQVEACRRNIGDLDAKDRRKLDPATPEQLAAEKRRLADLSVAVISVADVQGVELRSLRITSPGAPRVGPAPKKGFHAIELKDAGLKMAGCAVVGCLTDGVHAEGRLNVEIDDCLIAGCAHVGLHWPSPGPGRLVVMHSDIRSCALGNISAANFFGETVIEHCRISDCPATGLRVGGRPLIRHNAIFKNGEGISANGDCLIKQNLFYKNGVGVACWTGYRCWLDGNLFLENRRGGVLSYGPSEPMIRRNVFVGSPSGVEYGPQFSGDVRISPVDKYYVRENLFWRVDRPLARSDIQDKQSQAPPENVELPAADKNRLEDPLLAVDSEGRILLAEDSPARQIDFAGITDVSLTGCWPITAEEREMSLGSHTPEATSAKSGD